MREIASFYLFYDKSRQIHEYIYVFCHKASACDDHAEISIYVDRYYHYQGFGNMRIEELSKAKAMNLISIDALIMLVDVSICFCMKNLDFVRWTS